VPHPKNFGYYFAGDGISPALTFAEELTGRAKA